MFGEWLSVRDFIQILVGGGRMARQTARLAAPRRPAVTGAGRRSAAVAAFSDKSYSVS
jgi:hypothetical protein